MTRGKVSVCIATYNGSSYIKEQIDSIICQLIEGDEIIIVDDCSTDNTIEIIQSYKNDFIKLFRNTKNINHVQTFAKGISLAENEFICLCDQDDVWVEGRLQLLFDSIYHSNALLVSSNFHVIGNSNNQSFYRLKSENSEKYFHNIMEIFTGKTGYYGCTMIFRRELLRYVLPIPNCVEAHDLWIAIVANILKKNKQIDEETLYHRVHQRNTSLRKRSIYRKFRTRIIWVWMLLVAKKRIFFLH